MLGGFGRGGFFSDGGVELLDEIAVGLGESVEGEFEGLLLNEKADIALTDEGGARGEDRGGGGRGGLAGGEDLLGLFEGDEFADKGFAVGAGPLAGVAEGDVADFADGGFGLGSIW